MDSQIKTNTKNQDEVEERWNEREVGALTPRIQVERISDSRSRPGSRETSGDRERSPIHGRSSGADTTRGPLPSCSAAGNAEKAETSGTRALRTRSGRVYVPTDDGEEEDGAESDSSVGSIRSARSNCSSSTPLSSTKKKRGRPPTTGDYIGLAEAKRQYVEASRAEDEVREVESILDASLPVRKPCRGAIPLPDETTLAREYRNRPTADVAASVLEFQTEVERVASVSKGLQGGLVRALRIAALNTRTAIMELTTRSASAATRKLEEENNLLKGEVAQMRRELEELRRKMDGGETSWRLSPPTVHQEVQQRMEVEPLAPEATPPHVTAMPPPPPPPMTTALTPASRTTTLPTAPAKRMKQVAEEHRRRHEESLGYSGGDHTSPTTTPSAEEELMHRISAMIDAKLRNINGGQQQTGGPKAAAPVPSPRTVATPVAGEGGGKKKGGKTAKGGKHIESRGEQKATLMQESASPRQAENVPPPKPTITEWAKVVGRKEKRKEKATTASSSANDKGSHRNPNTAGKGKGAPAGPKRAPLPARPPRTAAVTVTAPAGGKVTLEEVMATVTRKIKLADVGINRLRPKAAKNGGLIIEVPGKDGAAKADNLAAKMSEILEGTGARVARPVKMAELRVRGLIVSTTPADVAGVVAEIGGCRVEEVQTGEIRRASSGLGTLWIRCPAAAARKVAVQRRITVGWMEVVVEPLQARPLQCYKCLEVGHTRGQCPSEADRSGRCFNCGDPSHKASACTVSPKCPVCTDKGRPAGHRLGGRACKGLTSAKKKRGEKEKSGDKAAVPESTKAGTNKDTSAQKKEQVERQPPAAGPAGPEGESMITE